MNTNQFALFSIASATSMLGVACGGQVVFEVGGAGGTGSSPATTGVTTKASSTTHVGTQSAVVGTTVAVTNGVVSSANVGTTGTGPDCPSSCEMQHPSGLAVLESATIQSCGCHNDSPCKVNCQGTQACAFPTGTPMGQCADCLETQAQQGTNSACELNGATSPQCQTNADCSDLIACVLSCP